MRNWRPKTEYQGTKNRVQTDPLLGVAFLDFLAEAAAEQRMSDFNSQGLANAAWAFATADQSDASLFGALATAAEHIEQCMGSFNPADLLKFL